MAEKKDVETTVREIRRKTRKKYSAEEKIRIVLEGLRGENGIAELCRGFQHLRFLSIPDWLPIAQILISYYNLSRICASPLGWSVCYKNRVPSIRVVRFFISSTRSLLCA